MVWTQAEGSRRLIGGDGISRAPVAVWEDNLVISYIENNQHKLYLHDSNGVDTPIATSAGDMVRASMYSQAVVYENRQAGAQPQVWIWDPVNGGRPIHPTSSSQTNPRIWGDQVVYEDNRNGRDDIYLWNPSDGETKLSTYIYSMVSPAIYQNKVVMWLLDNQYASNLDAGLWEWTPQHGLRQLAQIGFSSPYDVMYTRTWGDLVVWQSGNGPSSIGAWDPAHGLMGVNQTAYGQARSPSIFENQVAWVGDYDIYLSTLVPEPSGLATLGLLACGFWPIIRRRRRQ